MVQSAPKSHSCAQFVVRLAGQQQMLLVQILCCRFLGLHPSSLACNASYWLTNLWSFWFAQVKNLLESGLTHFHLARGSGYYSHSNGSGREMVCTGVPPPQWPSWQQFCGSRSRLLADCLPSLVAPTGKGQQPSWPVWGGRFACPTLHLRSASLARYQNILMSPHNNSACNQNILERK